MVEVRFSVRPRWSRPTGGNVTDDTRGGRGRRPCCSRRLSAAHRSAGRRRRAWPPSAGCDRDGPDVRQEPAPADRPDRHAPRPGAILVTARPYLRNPAGDEPLSPAGHGGVGAGWSVAVRSGRACEGAPGVAGWGAWSRSGFSVPSRSLRPTAGCIIWALPERPPCSPTFLFTPAMSCRSISWSMTSGGGTPRRARKRLCRRT